MREVELLQRRGQFGVGLFVESGKAHVADAGTHIESDVHGVLGDFVARNRESQRIVIAFADHGDMHDCALGALEQVGDFGGGQPVRGFAFHRVDDVARTNARFRRPAIPASGASTTV